MPAAGNIPGSRWSSVSWTDSSGHLWLFGGFGFFDTVGNTGDLNDLWEFNPSANEWTWMGGTNKISCKTVAGGVYACGQPGVYGTLGVPATGNFPGGRQNATSWTDSSGHFWLFGGEGLDAAGNGGDLNDLWEFDPSTNEWAWMGGSSAMIFVTNGYSQPGVYGTLGTPAAGNTPGGRFTASGWTDSNSHLWLFGGVGYDANGKDGYFNDLWEFNPSTKEWAWMGGSSTFSYVGWGQPGVYGTFGTPAAGNFPGGRQQATNWTDSVGHLWLFGGGGEDWDGIQGDWIQGNFNDLWEFNPSTNEWAWMGGSSTVGQPGVYGILGTPAAGNVPGSRFNASSWTDSSGHLWLFGGDGSDANGNSGLLNDLWRYQP
jgi:N-acetylneuraminic acid mutarotase